MVPPLPGKRCDRLSCRRKELPVKLLTPGSIPRIWLKSTWNRCPFRVMRILSRCRSPKPNKSKAHVEKAQLSKNQFLTVSTWMFLCFSYMFSKTQFCSDVFCCQSEYKVRALGTMVTMPMFRSTQVTS